MQSSLLKVACIQQACVADSNTNINTCKENIRRAAKKGVKLIVLQELHNNLYFCQSEKPENFDLAENIPGPATEIYAALAKQLDVVIVCSLFEKRAVGLYHNTAVVLDTDGSLAGIYRKMHIPDDPGYYEKYYFTPGDLGFDPIPTSIGNIGVLICWDQWFPEAARLMALAGADLLVYPTAIGWDTNDSKDAQMKQLDAWRIIQRAHAVSNNLPVIVANRVGHEDLDCLATSGINFWGSSFIAGQQGELLTQANTSEDAILVAELDLAQTEKIRRNWPFFRDRRIDNYFDLVRRYLD